MKNFRYGKYKGPIVRIKNPRFEFDEEKDRRREEHLLQKEQDIVSPGTNPIKREIFEGNPNEKKKKMTVENKFLRGSLERNPYYMKDADEEEEDPRPEENSVGSARSISKDSKSKMHETAKNFFERNDLQGTKELSKYDCWDQDLSPEEWIEKCNIYPERTHARCPFYREGRYVWLPVKVISYDYSLKRYLVKHVDTGVQKKVERLSLLFDEEDRNLFRDRVHQCKFYQRRAEDEMRFQAYAEKIDNKFISSLSKEWTENILSKALGKRRRNKEEDPQYLNMQTNKMVQTVSAEYNREMKKCYVLSEMKEKSKLEFFLNQKIDIRREVKKVEYFGTIGLLPSNPNYFVNQKSLSNSLLISESGLEACLVDFAKKSAEKITTQIFNYHIPSAALPLSMQAFQNMQKSHHSENTHSLNNLWREAQITTISGVSGYNVTFSKEEFNKDKKKLDRTFRFFRRMDLFFRNHVKQLAEYNLNLYLEFVRQYVMPENFEEGDGMVWKVSHKPLLTLTIKTKEFIQTATDEKDNKGEKKKPYKPTDEDCIFFEPSEINVVETMCEPIKLLMKTINSINTLESNILKGFGAEEKPIYPVDENTPAFKKALEEVRDLMTRSFREPNRILSSFRKNTYLLKKSSEEIVKTYLDKQTDSGKDRTEGGNTHKSKKSNERKSVEDLDGYMQTVESSIGSIQAISINEKNTNFFLLHTKESKNVLITKANLIRNSLLKRISGDCQTNVLSIKNRFVELTESIKKDPTDEVMYDELMQIVDVNDKATEKDKNNEKYHEKIIEKLEQETDEVGKYFDLFFKYSRDQQKNNENERAYFYYFALKRFPYLVKYEAKEARGKSVKFYEVFVKQVNTSKFDLSSKITKLEMELEDWKTKNYEEWAKRYLENNDFNKAIDVAVQDKESLNTREKLLGLDPSSFDSLTKLITNYEPYREMRNLGTDFDTEKSKWENTAIFKLRYKEVAQKIEQIYKKINTLSRKFESMEDAGNAVEICQNIIGTINKFKGVLPIIKNLTKDALIKKPVYWLSIVEATQLPGLKSVQQVITLNELINSHKIMDHIEVLDEICTRAEKEYSLDVKYNEEVLEILKKKRLEYMAHKNTGTYIIAGVDDIMQLLDEKLTLLMIMKQNPNIKPIKGEVEKTEKKLRTYQDMFDAWVKCQRDWIYLEPIFSADGMEKELPDPTKWFKEVDKKWRIVMGQIKEDNLIFENSEWERIQSTLNSNNELLDKVQKSLNTYLTSKREDFPRFYFLSDEELLEILSRAKEPTLVTKYIKKCFEGIDLIEFTKNLEVTKMISAEKEVVEFEKPVVTNQGDRKGRVEKWLTDLESMMRETLIKKSIKCAKDDTQRTKWVLQHPGQIVLAVNNTRWTLGVEESIDLEGVPGLKKYYNSLIKDREDIVEMVKGELTSLQRTTLGALIVIDQHAIYVVEMLIENQLRDKQDFDWVSQLRYYMRIKDKEKIKVEIITSSLSYQYEYLGNSDRLVITPLTDRCYRTLMGAFQYNYGGAPEGPAGTGKTETVKDLAKAIAVQCQVFNCSDQINYVAMNKFFKGLSQCGSWCCFDEFNRIAPDVLSVIAEQVRTIQEAIRAGLSNFRFDGVMCRLVHSAFTCITMNPGYAGRSELPDNLKALFRPCAMMVPEYSLISEIVLFSYGYQTATSLAKKIVASLRLSSEQLSNPKHYDFGMRALKAILVAAGNLKKKYNKEDEDKLCIRALFDVNLPKFTQNDIPLFYSITTDLFTDIKPPETDYTELIAAIKEQTHLKQILPEPVLIKKCIELYETLLVRHGLMQVGETNSGKTCVTNVLRDSLTALNGVLEFRKTKDFWLNPKAVDSYQLYGKLDTNTKLWTDGILPQIMRVCENDSENPERKWIVFDGPVDAVWIENMNTVLDDNKILCLTNGQKIKVTPQMNMMFEVENLLDASPATVSRCGMVYLEPTQLGWKPLVLAYTKYKLAAPLLPMTTYLNMTFVWMLSPVLEYVRKNSKFPFLVDSMQMTASVLRMFDALCSHLKDPEYKGTDKEGKEGEAIVNNYVLFSIVWGVGGVIEDSRFEFNQFLRKLVGYDNVQETFGLDLNDPSWEPRGLSYNWGDSDNLYEIMFDVSNNTWIPWLKTVPKWVPPKQEIPYNELIVPTSDMVRNSYLINLMIQNNSHILLTGPTGTAKTISAINEINTNYKGKDIGNLMMVFSGQTSANQVQLMIEAKMNIRIKKFHYGPEDNKKKMVVFIDDVNMPIKEEYGAQPPIELLRMWADHGFLYDLQERTPKYFHNMQLLCSMGPPSTGRNMVTRRFLRHFFILYTEPFDGTSLSTIFSSIMDWYFLGMKGKLPSSIVGLRDQIISGTVQVYTKVIAKLLPTPKKSHYIYNLRDVSRVIQGITKATAYSFSDPNDLIKLWAHECMRVFSDRLINKEDVTTFNEEILKPVMNETFKKGWNSIVKLEPLLFASFVPTRYPDNDTSKIAYPNVYCELVNRDNLIKYSEMFQQKYNEGGISSEDKDKLNLVLFMTALEHLVRIVRILGTSFGHALLVGVGGSGKKSLAKLSTFILDYDKFSIEVTKAYDIKKDWPEDLMELLKKCGLEDRPTTFLFNDTQIFKEAILEDISSILNQGEVPNLFPPEEKANIINEISETFPNETETLTTNQRFEFFIRKCKKNLHLALCFSPVGEQFRKRLRTFPSLINCTTIDWFLPWPNDALRSVSLSLLKDSDLSHEELQKVSDIFVVMQERVVELSKKYLEELRKYFYVTPTSYIELVNCLKNMYTKRIKDINSNISRYRTGLGKISNAKVEVLNKKEELRVLQPQLAESTIFTDKLIETVQREQIDADREKEICEKDKAECNIIKEEANKLKAICQVEVDKAEEILNKSKEELEKIQRKDIDELKQTKAPTESVKLLFQALCIIMDVEVKMVKDPNDAMKKIPDYLTPVRNEIMKDSTKMVVNLKSYDDTKISAEIQQSMIDKIKGMMDKFPLDFNRGKLDKSSKAAGALFVWLETIIEVYDKLLVVNPMRENLRQAQAKVDGAERQLKEKVDNLQMIMDRITELKKQQKEAEAKKQDLKFQVARCQSQVIAAEDLTKGFSQEEITWEQRAKSLEKTVPNILGESLVASGVIAFLGAFPMDYRHKTIEYWIKVIKDKQITIGDDFNLREVCADDLTITNWVDKYKLPNDAISIENAIIIEQSKRFPLIIDPQLQATKWLKELYKEPMDKSIKIIRAASVDKNTPHLISLCITEGFPVLVEGVGESIDSMFESVFDQIKEYEGKKLTMKFIDKFYDLHPNFKFFVTTKLSKPHYPPEICAKVTLINFTVTPEGLEDQLVNTVVGIEDSKLEQRRQASIKRSFELTNKQRETESKILTSLSNQVGNILDDTDLINTLNESKKDSNEGIKELEKIENNNKNYKKTCAFYKEVGFRVSHLFFCVMDMSNVDPMYQFSLEWFLTLFKAAVETQPKIKETRVKDIITIFTDSLFIRVCRSLFEKDKLLFSFLIYLKRLVCDNVVKTSEVRQLLLNVAAGQAATPNPYPEWTTDKQWNILNEMNTRHEFKGILDDFKTLNSEWRRIYESPQPQSEPLPGKWEMINSIQRLIILKVLRSDKIIQAIQNLIKKEMGNNFVEFETFSLKSVYDDSKNTTPIVFILSPGSDPLAEVKKLSKRPGITATVEVLSLGQGQEKAAENALNNARKNGEWIVLQNCHLAPGFLSNIEKGLDIDPSTIHPNYRVWLTSMPTDKFPVTILQNGVKVTNEPPRGIKASLIKNYMGYDNKILDDMKEPANADAWKKLVFGLSFFHAIVLERKKFGPLGWNIQYQFSQMDMNISMSQVKTFLEGYQEIEWKALLYLIAEANYGGRVTDPMDRRLIKIILGTYFTPKILTENYKFSESGTYYAPESGNVDSYLDYIKNILPLNDEPEVFGMHSNANITSGMNDTNELFAKVLELQPQISEGGASSTDNMIKSKCVEIVSSMPAAFDVEKAEKAFPILYIESMNTVLQQELIRFNRLLSTIKSTLIQLEKAIDGTIIMSIELEEVYNKVFLYQVPDLWHKVSYPSLKPLTSWIADFTKRLDYIRNWLEHGQPKSFWLSGFFSTQSFLTGTLQNYARKVTDFKPSLKKR